ncbi:MAG: hypothetical protein AB8B99_01095 [Phormidesmis sp.]
MSFFNVDDAEGERLSLAKPLKTASPTRVAFWISLWFVVGLALRLTNLTLKAAWMDEVATTLFSLGNYSGLIPLNEILNLDQILRPLAVTPGTTTQDVISHLLREDNHPPTYFVLAHWWMKLFPAVNGYASLWGERALSALFGALAIPATYWLAQCSFRDYNRDSILNMAETRTISLMCAAIMAVSPFGIFMAQEARHYTLGILAAIASLACFVLAAKAVGQHKAPSWQVILAWIVINTIGLTIHFFIGLTLIAEGMTLLWMLIQQCRTDGADVWSRVYWRRMYAAAVGTLAGGLLWLPILLNFYGSPQTSFLRSEGRSWQFWINPIVQSLASWLYTVLSPVTGGYGWPAVVAIVVTCLGLLLLYAPWLIATLRKSLLFQWKKPPLRFGIGAIGGFFVMANVLFLIICYGSGFDITRGHRYSFVFFPSVVLLVGVGLAPFWQESQDIEQRQHFKTLKLPFVERTVPGRRFVATVMAIAIFGCLVIVNHYSNLKFYRPERFIDLMQATSSHPVVIGTETIVTEQPSVVGIEIMSVAWEIEQRAHREANKAQQASKKVQQETNKEKGWVKSPRFIIAEKNPSKGLESETQLSEAIASLSGPFDLWLLSMNPALDDIQCQQEKGGNKGSFAYVHYTCAGNASLPTD